MLSSTTRRAIGCILTAAACSVAGAETDFAARARRMYAEAQETARQQPTNTQVVVQLARAAFDWAEFARDDDQREDLALAGMVAARRALARESTNAAAHYWLGMNLGQLARTKMLGALKLVREIEAEFLRAAALDPHVDYAGPDRSLGYLYRDAPGWPTSLGNKKKAREHFERAVQLHPEFPDNQLGLLESFDQWADRKNFALQLPKTEKSVAEARGRFTGEAWDSSWADWNKRLASMKMRSGDVGRAVPSKGVK